jgi:phosphoglycolate phosphatase-like HAD superfamily hydrolase
VGDRYSDIELAANAGVKSGLVLSGYGRGEWEHHRDNWTMRPDLVAENLLEAVSLISSLDVVTTASRKTT